MLWRTTTCLQEKGYWDRLWALRAPDSLALETVSIVEGQLEQTSRCLSISLLTKLQTILPPQQAVSTTIEHKASKLPFWIINIYYCRASGNFHQAFSLSPVQNIRRPTVKDFVGILKLDTGVDMTLSFSIRPDQLRFSKSQDTINRYILQSYVQSICRQILQLQEWSNSIPRFHNFSNIMASKCSGQEFWAN